MNHDLRYVAAAGALAVALGAFGAHALEGLLEPARAEVYDTANFYHFAHVLAMLVVCGLAQLPGFDESRCRLANRLFAAGLLLFSGSLYVLATRGLIGLESASWLGMITPLGGLALIAGWVVLCFAARAYTTR